MEIKDQLNRKLILKKIPQRIVSLVPSQTELLVDLGLRDKIVGVTNFCIHPAEIRKETKVVGGTKSIHLDRIKALNPDLIFCNKEENTKEMVEELEQFYPIHVSDINSLKDNQELIEQYGKIFDIENSAKNIIDKINAEYEEFEQFVSDKPLLKVAYFIWRKPWMVVGNNTFIQHLLTINKYQNVYADCTRYPEIDLKNLRSADYYFLSSEPFPFQEKHKDEMKEFVQYGDFAFVDGEYFSWYGSRMQKAFSYFKKLRLELEKEKNII